MFVLADAKDVFTTDPFKYFNLNEIATDPAMQATAASFYQLLQVIALGVIVITAIIAVIKWAITPPGKKQGSIVEIVGWKLIVVALVGAFVEIVGLVFMIIDRAAGSM